MNRVTHAAIVDATDEETLRKLGCSNFDAVVVAIGENLEANILATVAAKSVGARHVISKAASALAMARSAATSPTTPMSRRPRGSCSRHRSRGSRISPRRSAPSSAFSDASPSPRMCSGARSCSTCLASHPSPVGSKVHDDSPPQAVKTIGATKGSLLSDKVKPSPVEVKAEAPKPEVRRVSSKPPVQQPRNCVQVLRGAQPALECF